ncbi:heparanase-like [Lytechinus variegatus]|uniref:heparanase-like n=1 Tax=Lytechinus variegatus TaxID=7654 RepID=UPI001BB13A33|nr:heparanase-like [Lytechinus variegatus]
MAINKGDAMMVVGRITMATISLVLVAIMMAATKMSFVEHRTEPGKRHLSTPDVTKYSAHSVVVLSLLSVNTTNIVTTVDERFLSIGATMGFIRTHLGQHFNSTRYWTLARGLSPAIYRLGGAEADFTVFKENADPVNCTLKPTFQSKGPSENYGKLGFFNLTFCAHTWDNINEFARSVGWDILFTFNGLERNATSWDPTDAIHLLNYTKQRGYNVIWSLGNEPNGYLRKDNVSVNGTQMAEAFHTLRKSVSRVSGLSDIFLVGPDVSAPTKKIPAPPTPISKYLIDFLQAIGNTTNVTSFHFYYTDGRTAGFRDLTNPLLSDLLQVNIQSVQSLVHKYGSKANSKIWLTESGLCFGSMPTILNNAYADGMLYLDRLGMAARLGIDLIVSQGLMGKYGGIFGENIYPHLFYWLLLCHKRLMGTRVLDVSKVVSTKVESRQQENASKILDDDVSKYIRVYAHCTKTSALYQPGSITLLIINMIPYDDVQIKLEGALLNSTIHEYLLLPVGTKGILSPRLQLNGHLLKMEEDLTLPSLSPRKQPPGSLIMLPHRSYGFYVLPDAEAQACQ